MEYTVVLMSMSYLGLDQQYAVPITVEAAKQQPDE